MQLAGSRKSWAQYRQEREQGLVAMLQSLSNGRTLRIAKSRIAHRIQADMLSLQVNVPKTRRTYCKGKDCKKHTQHKVTQYKAGKVRNTEYTERGRTRD